MENKQIAAFDIDRDVLLKALQRVQSIVDRKNTIPILSHLLIEAQDDQILFSATDLEVGIRPGSLASARCSLSGELLGVP